MMEQGRYQRVLVRWSKEYSTIGCRKKKQKKWISLPFLSMTESQYKPSYETGEGMKVKVVKWCWKKWNRPIMKDQVQKADVKVTEQEHTNICRATKPQTFQSVVQVWGCGNIIFSGFWKLYLVGEKTRLWAIFLWTLMPKYTTNFGFDSLKFEYYVSLCSFYKFPNTSYVYN